jgi:hypothetical protein
MVTDTKSLHTVSMRGVVIPAVLVFAAVAWWASRDGDAPRVAEASPGFSSAIPASRPSGESDDDREPLPPEPAAHGAADASFAEYVDGKYRFLETPAELRAALQARERIAVVINTAKQSSDAAAAQATPALRAELAAMDQKIGALLRPADLAAFDILKDSDAEQFQLDDYAGGVAAVAPVSEADRKAILYTKLAHRQRFRQVLADSRLMSGELNASERQLALADVSRSLQESRDGYLREVRQYLHDDAQYTLLSNYENSEYAAELEKLRDIASGERGQ